MSNPYINHYTDIARRGHYGAGIHGYVGLTRYQKGHGLFGNFFRAIVPQLMPLLKFGGQEALKAAGNVFSDVVSRKRKFSESAKEHGMEGLKNLANEGIQSVGKVFKGSGRRKRRKLVKRPSILQSL